MYFLRREMACWALGLFLVSLASHQNVLAKETPTERVESQIQHAFSEIDRSQMSVLVSYVIGDGSPVTVEFGSLRDDDVSAAGTQIDLLSLTKSLTAVSILKLVEEERLRPGDAIRRYLGGVPEDKAGITIHQLLTHSSGLRNSCGHDHDHLKRSELLQCAFDAPLLSHPGTKYEYSNVGYSLLAAIIEEISEMSFETYLLEVVGKGLELRHTGYESAIDDARAIRSKRGQTLSSASWGGQKPHWNLIGNGGLVSTPDEFLRFRKALARGEIVSHDLLQLAQTAHVPEDATARTHYGYGVVVQDTESVGPLVWHNGGSGEFSSEWNEMKELDLIVFAAGHATRGKHAYKALEIVRKHLRELKD